MNYGRHLNDDVTPQNEPVPCRPTVPNSSGGYSFAVDDWTRLERFLILGCEGGSYYATERTLTRENAEAVVRCAQADGVEAVRRIVAVSDAGRAPKNDPAIFALALRRPPIPPCRPCAAPARTCSSSPPPRTNCAAGAGAYARPWPTGT